jgi:creatinine amidohydrolase
LNEGSPNKNLFLQNMTWEEVRDALGTTKTILIPTGSTENAGPHLPLSNETEVAVEIARRAADKLAVFVAPPLYFGISEQHMAFAGTISIRPDSFAGVIRDMCTSFHRHGFKYMIIVNGHSGNTPTLQAVASELRQNLGIVTAVTQWFTMIPGNEIKKVVERVYHAGEAETSLMLAVNKEAVRRNKLVSEVPEVKSKFLAFDFYAPGPKAIFPYPIKEVTKSGVIGDATKASLEKGEQILELAVKYLVEFVLDLESGKLP